MATRIRRKKFLRRLFPIKPCTFPIGLVSNPIQAIQFPPLLHPSLLSSNYRLFSYFAPYLSPPADQHYAGSQLSSATPEHNHGYDGGEGQTFSDSGGARCSGIHRRFSPSSPRWGWGARGRRKCPQDHRKQTVLDLKLQEKGSEFRLRMRCPK